MAVLRQWKIIQNSVDLYEFVQEQLQVPLEKASLKVDFHFHVNNYVGKTCAKKMHIVNFHFCVKSKYNLSLFYLC